MTTVTLKIDQDEVLSAAYRNADPEKKHEIEKILRDL